MAAADGVRIMPLPVMVARPPARSSGPRRAPPGCVRTGLDHPAAPGHSVKIRSDGAGMTVRTATPTQLRAPAFVGRRVEFAALSSALSDPEAVVLVEGEAGIGKSRLLREWLAARAGSGRRVIVASCPP